ncbi:LysR family transcriptional regulator [Pseudomonas sp. SST3]|uniref:LysR family transcriptional regulator n=1 Tax=Pseudomonas sp. SST3 TaxID=2267882 RepID=UPI0014441E27|nr:LysR family transcriptional regulator [Pseudomonas sp. SST3]NKQ13256.1 LysR family transcriptional regulator [Pseudomonas sp. SST3]
MPFGEAFFSRNFFVPKSFGLFQDLCALSYSICNRGYSVSLDHLNWNDLRIFLAVARTGNLLKAARKLSIDQSTVSRRVAQLEYVLGGSLFERNHMGFALNGFGGELLESVQEMDNGFVALTATLERRSNALHGPVRIGTMEGIASLYLSSRLVDLNREFPAITVELVTSAQQLYVSRREADVFLGFFKPHGKGLDTEHMGRFFTPSVCCP